MIDQSLTIPETDFVAKFAQSSEHFMWLLGAGTSRSAGMPSATDLIWELKRRYYCVHENQSISDHDVGNTAIQARIQSYFEGKNCPPLWSNEEYPFYFELNFGQDYGAQQKFLAAQLSSEKISVNIGHRALAAFMANGSAKVVFTTNFDEVIEAAYSAISSQNLTPFHLEGSYAALDALNAERFPIYAKLHGDFRYTSIKNLEKDLVSNDEEIRRCFLAAATRFGIVVTGYSGRDSNVMTMMRDALAQNNAFPQGLFWTVPRASEVADAVLQLLQDARSKGIDAHVVETGTFDVMLSKMWKQVPVKSNEVDEKVRTAAARPVQVQLPPPGRSYPIVRTNALPIVHAPKKFGMVNLSVPYKYTDLNDAMSKHMPNGIFAFTDKVVFWGSEADARKTLPSGKITAIGPETVEDPVSEVAGSTILKSFYEHALAKALCNGKPLLLRKRNKTYYIVIDGKQSRDDLFSPLAQALAFKGQPGYISGNVPKLASARWAEAVSVRLEEKNGCLWLLLRPDIWISPLSERDNATPFIRQKKLYRYNPKSYAVLDAWISILIGAVGKGSEARVGCHRDTEFPAEFVIGTRTGFSGRGGLR